MEPKTSKTRKSGLNRSEADLERLSRIEPIDIATAMEKWVEKTLRTILRDFLTRKPKLAN